MGMIFGISGFIGSGKGTVATYLTDHHGFRKDSFAASLKDVCSAIFGWPRDLLEGETVESRAWREQVDEWWSSKLNIPNFSPRSALQLVGTNALRNNLSEELWTSSLENRIRKNPSQHVVISDVRFPNEVKFIQDQGGIMIRVKRGPDPEWYPYAKMANAGNHFAKSVMSKTYASVHQSEWAWAGTKFDFEINNTTFDSLFDEVTKAVNSVGILLG